ncbi:MAG: YegP family protein [Clostridia bacterium]|nr:YegP family protein [Clostridia bacterium]
MFNVRAGNTQVIASSQIYSSMAACRNGINSVGTNAPIAAIEDQTLSSINEEKCPKFQIYTDKSGKYRFNLLAANGQNILACTQGYTQKASCKNGIQSVIANAHAKIVLPRTEDDE